MLYTLRSLAKNLFSRKLSPAPSRRPSSVRLDLETLEDRQVPSASPWATHFFAPYVNTLQDQKDARFNDYATAAQNAGTKYLTLGFITANNAGQPGWEGNGNELGSGFDVQMQKQVNNLRANGGDVMISFGGASGTELALANQDVNRLRQAYQQVIDEYGLTHVDFDIEGNAATDNSGSIDRRSQAIAGLRPAQGEKELQVYFTLQTSSRGLRAGEGLTVLDSALRNGVKIAGVNLMTMDYADFVNYDGVTGPTMGDAAISAAKGLFGQLHTELAKYGQDKPDAQVWQMIGITPQIGVNVQYVDGVFHGTEVFSQADARNVETFAQNTGIGQLGFWAIGVDQNPDNITNDPNPQETYSGVSQQAFDFSHIFAPFTSDAPVPVATPGTPTNLAASASDGQVSLTWTPVAGATSYNIYRGTVSGAENPVPVATGVTNRSFTDAGLADGTTYFYVVTAVNAAGESASSAEVSATPQAQGLSALASFAVTQDWGTGFTGYITLTNMGNTPITGWTLEFDFTGNITEIWNANILSHVGNHYVIQNADWNTIVYPGQSTSVGFNADWGGDGTAPANYILNGVGIPSV